MFGKWFLTLAMLAGFFLAALPGWAVGLVEDEALFGQVSRVAKKYDNCTNNGNTYNLEITGQVDGMEKTIRFPYVKPNKMDSEDNSRAEAEMAAFCEKAALLTKSQPDKHDLYIQIKYETSGSGNMDEVGLCTGTSGAGKERGTQLICELR